MMKICDHLPAAHIYLDQRLADKEALLRFVARAFVANRIVADHETLYQGLVEREQTMSTGIGGGLGLPHATSGDARRAALVLVRLARPMDYMALDHRPVDVVIALVVPAGNRRLHLQMLAGLSRICREPEFITMVRRAPTPEALCQAIRDLEAAIPFH